MSYLSQLLVPCEDLQYKISDVWQKDTTMPNDGIPFLQYINSPTNANRIEAEVAPGSGKVRNVNVTYFQRLLESTVTDATKRGCDVGEAVGNCVTQYSIDTTDLVQSKERISAEQLKRYCDNNGNFMAERLLMHLNVIDRKTATKIAGEAALLNGPYSNDAEDFFTVTDNSLQIATKDASGNYAIGAHQEIKQATSMTGYDSALIFGGASLQQYMDLTLAGCCADSGLNVEEIYALYGYAFAYDRRLATALGGQTQNLVMEPGALQLLQYQQEGWKSNMPVDFQSGYASFPLTTPSGVKVDVYIKDNCPGNVDINIFANTKLVGLPEDLFGTGDNFEGVKYVNKVTVNNP